MTNPILPVTVFLGQASNSNSALVTFIVYTLAVFVLAWFSHRLLSKKKFLSEYYLGSRGLGVVALTLSYGATSASAGSFAGFPALIYSHGWILALWIASYMLVPLCGMGILGKRINQVSRRAGAITLPDMLRGRFESPAVALLATFMIMFMLSFYLIPQFKIASIIMGKLFADVPAYTQTATRLTATLQSIPLFKTIDGGYLICLIIFALLTIAYTAFGGFRAVVWTDVLQGFVMIFGVVFMLVMALVQVGGLSAATEKMSQMTTPRLGTMVFEIDTKVTGDDITIDRDIWLTAPDSQTNAPMLLRTNNAAVIAFGATESNEIKIVHITTPQEIERIESSFKDGAPPPLPVGVRPRIKTLDGYKAGADASGSYVTGPGPHADSAIGFLPFGLAISFFFFWALSGTGQPGNMVRLMAFDSSKTLRRSISALTIYYGMIYFPLIIIFCCARVLIPGLDQAPDRIMPEMAFHLADAANVPWMAGLLVAAPFAAAMSTVDSFMLIISSSVVRDVYQRNINPDAPQKTIKKLSYAVTVIVGIVVTIGAINPPKFLQYLIVFCGGGLSVSFLIPVVLALYWPRCNIQGLIAAMLGGFSVYLGLYFAGYIIKRESSPVRPLDLDPLVWGFAASLILGVTVALLTPPPPKHLVAKFFHRRAKPSQPPQAPPGSETTESS